MYGGERKDSMFVHAAASGAAAAVAGAFSAVGATDTVDTFFLRFANVKDHAAQYGANDGDNQKINRFHRQLFALESILRFDFLVSIDAQVNDDGNHNRHSDQTGQEACAESAGGDQCADLVNAVTYHVANT